MRGLDLHVDAGEFMVLVGPSGCGKTSALRMVAGLEQISGGTLRFGDRVVNEVPPRQRDVAMVFQNYALYPHLTVAQNIAFALENRKMPKAERERRVREAASILGLTPMLGRKPRQLSGGQRQRVAMGRAIVREPAIFLMDEPLSNLDAKLRVQMRTEVLRVHRRIGAATLYVTHDQTEAMTMGDRVAVLRDGVLQQAGAPRELYDRPGQHLRGHVHGLAVDEPVRGGPGGHRGGGGTGPGPPAAVPAPGGTQAGQRPGRLPRRDRDRRHPPGEPGRPGCGRDGAGAGDQPHRRRPAGRGARQRAAGPLPPGRAAGPGGSRAPRAAERRAGSAAATVAAESQGEIVAATVASGVARVDPRARIRPHAPAVLAVDVERLHFFDPATGTAIS